MACQGFIVFSSWYLVLSAASNRTLIHRSRPIRGQGVNIQPISGQHRVTSQSRGFIVTKSQWLLLHQTMLLDLEENLVTSRVAKFETHLQTTCRHLQLDLTWHHRASEHISSIEQLGEPSFAFIEQLRPEFLYPEVRHSLVYAGHTRSWWQSLFSFQNIFYHNRMLRIFGEMFQTEWKWDPVKETRNSYTHTWNEKKSWVGVTRIYDI